MNEDAPSVTVHPLMWADEPDHAEDTYVAAVFTSEEALREYVADVALQGVTIVGAHQHAPVQLHGLPPGPATAPDTLDTVRAAWAAMPETVDQRDGNRPNDWTRADLRRTVPRLAVTLDALGQAPPAAPPTLPELDPAVVAHAAHAAAEAFRGSAGDDGATWDLVARAAIYAYREVTW